MGKALLIVIAVVIFVYALFDLIATPSSRVRFIPKPLWFLVLLIVPIGPLLWVFFGATREAGPTPPPQRPGWRPPSPRGPDDDPDYLRGL